MGDGHSGVQGPSMTRTTPPRPRDVETLFPELAAHRGTTTRLHPQPGAPGDVGELRRRADAVAAGRAVAGVRRGGSGGLTRPSR